MKVRTGGRQYNSRQIRCMNKNCRKDLSDQDILNYVEIEVVHTRYESKFDGEKHHVVYCCDCWEERYSKHFEPELVGHVVESQSLEAAASWGTLNPDKLDEREKERLDDSLKAKLLSIFMKKSTP